MVLLGVALLGLAVAGGRWLLLETRRDVVVKIFNVDGIENVFIDCHLAIHVETGEPSRTVDLGWLKPDDRIFLSTTSIDSSPAWGFFGTANGSPLFDETRGETELPQYDATANAVVFARAFSAGGAELGAIGCQPPKLVASDAFEADGYAYSPDDEKVAEVTAARSSYRRSNGFYDAVDAIGGWSLVVLAALGAFTAFLTPSIRRFVWEHKAGLAAGTVSLLGLGVVESILPTILTVGGILLLLLVALLLVGEGLVGLRRGVAARGATGA
jgi:hypothetical protein